MTALVVLIIAYGSLYPFQIRHVRPPEGAILFLLETVIEAPESRGDVLANILLYMPFGFFALLMLGSWKRIRRPLRVVTIAGAVLSTSMELTQFFDAGRVCNFSDLYVNGFGAFLGGVIARIVGPNFRVPFFSQAQEDVFPGMLLASWFLFRLYPYVPTIDLHKYWHALWPLFVSPSLALDDLIRFVVCWCLVANLAERLSGWPRARRVYFLLGMVEIVGKVFILNNELKPADLIGLLAGLPLWQAVRRLKRREAVMAGMIAALILILRLQPFRLEWPLHAFSWIPFRGFLQGSLSVDTQSFLEKFFYYGAMIWALVQAGIGLPKAASWLALGLLVTSLIETALPGRSAEITDAVMALAIAVLYRSIAERGTGGLNAARDAGTVSTARSAAP